MPFELPPLPYDREALAPHMSAETLDYHHGKHHRAYVDKTNELVEAGSLQGKSLVDLIKGADKGPLRNNAAQIWNHSFFWQGLMPASAPPTGQLATLIERDFGSTRELLEGLAKEATAHFGSGWAWLVLHDDTLKIISLHDGDTPVAYPESQPLFTLDVWEHAYYIDYRNARPKFIAAVLDNIVNWDFVALNLDGKGVSRADQPA